MYPLRDFIDVSARIGGMRFSKYLRATLLIYRPLKSSIEKYERSLFFTLMRPPTIIFPIRELIDVIRHRLLQKQKIDNSRV